VKRLVVRLMQTSLAFCAESSNGVIAFTLVAELWP
jgi:hypothetical protein